MTQKRITKQQMKEDHFVTAVFRAREWTEVNLNTILIAAGALIVVAVAIWFFIGQSSRKSQESYDLLGRAEVEMRNNQAQIAVIDFQKVIDDFGGTLFEENVHRSCDYINQTSFEEMLEMIRQAGFRPAMRNAFYEIVKEYPLPERVPFAASLQ